MTNIHPLAEALNNQITVAKNCVIDLLSEKGRGAFFPSKGILGQSAEAKSSQINATIGTAFEEDGSPLALECLEEMINLPSTAFLYAPSFGLPDLREKWQTMLSEKNPTLAGKSISTPVVTNALTHGISVAGFMFTNPDDSIILPDMYWGNYNLVLKQAYNVKLQTYPTFQNQEFNIAGLEKLLNQSGKKKIILLNYPNNPTGYTATKNEAKQICQVLKQAADNGKQIVVLLDDAYFGLVYQDDVYQESLFAPLADLHSNILAVKLDGPTKEDYAWGFRIGFITFACKNATAEQYKALEAKAAGIVRGSISNSSRISQELLLKAYQSKTYKQEKENKFNILKARYKMICQILAENPQYQDSFKAMPFNSGYFMCVQPQGVDSEAVRQELLNNFSTGVIAIPRVIRIAFSAVPQDKLATLFANLHQAIQNLKNK